MPKKFIVGITIVLLAIVYFMFTGVSKGTAYYITVNDLTTNGDSYIGDRLRMGGVVLDGTIENDVKTLNVNFKIHQDEAVIPVVYNGITPDMFKDGSDVIIEGVYTEEGVFEADLLLAKCASKYESKEYEVEDSPHDEAAEESS